MHAPTYLLLALIALRSAVAAPVPGQLPKPAGGSRDRYPPGREPKVTVAMPIWPSISIATGAAFVLAAWLGWPPNEAGSRSEATPRGPADVPAYYKMDTQQREDYFYCYHHTKWAWYKSIPRSTGWDVDAGKKKCAIEVFIKLPPH